jgi:murein DD-endopeptidase MepM/ murein hydrolase activator NlpD
MRNEGINIAAELGAPFRAAADGTVSYVGLLRGYGNLILITHAHGYVTAYAHAENVAVARGEEVGKGQVIGTAGASGGVDRPQLHFEIRRGVKPVDPNLLLAANG